MYRVLVQLQAPGESKKIIHGQKGHCRFCGSGKAGIFRQLAHLVPEALGNRWIFSADECDACNQKFSRYEDALVAAVGSILTLGGTTGKSGIVRQTGRTTGNSVLKHTRVGGKRQLLMMARNVRDYRERVTQDEDWIVMRTPLPATPFSPLFAYKALLKMALALVPVADLARYSNLRQLLLDRDALLTERRAAVGLSFGSIGNAPHTVVATLFRRADDALRVPEFMFIVGVGSVCVQIFLTADKSPKIDFVCDTPRLQFNVVFRKPGAEDFRITYGDPRLLDWSSAALQPQPLKEMVLRYHPGTTRGEFIPVWR